MVAYGLAKSEEWDRNPPSAPNCRYGRMVMHPFCKRVLCGFNSYCRPQSPISLVVKQWLGKSQTRVRFSDWAPY